MLYHPVKVPSVSCEHIYHRKLFLPSVFLFLATREEVSEETKSKMKTLIDLLKGKIYHMPNHSQ